MPKSTKRDGTEWWPEGYDGYITIGYTLNYLKEQGYKLQEDKSWIRPQPPRIPTFPEIRAIRHLIEEWDYGGLEPYSIEDRCKVAEGSGFGFDSEGVRNRYKVIEEINDIEKIEKIIGIKN